MTRRVRSVGFAVMFLVFPGLSAAQERPLIMIDPGHGGAQAGVAVDGIEEKHVVLQTAFALGEILSRRGYDTRLTRTGDYALGGGARRTMAEEAGASLFVSLHFNGDNDPAAHGIEIYANLDDARAATAAETIAEALRAGGAPVTVEGREWGFLRSPTVPTVMIEAGFLTHPVEQRWILTEAYQHDVATRIADGVVRFLQGGR